MMHKKRTGFLVVLAAFVAGGAFAQAKGGANSSSGAKRALSVDTFPLIKGFMWSDSEQKMSLYAIAAAFEFPLASHFSAAIQADLYFGKMGGVDIQYLAAAGHGRYYPATTDLKGAFLDAGVGYNRFAIDGKTEAGFSDLFVSLKAGCKIVPKSKLFIEPSMSYVYSKTIALVPTPAGWQGGLALGFTF